MAWFHAHRFEPPHKANSSAIPAANSGRTSLPSHASTAAANCARAGGSHSSRTAAQRDVSIADWRDLADGESLTRRRIAPGQG